jgi:hypothetical protein
MDFNEIIAERTTFLIEFHPLGMMNYQYLKRGLKIEKF